MTKSRWQKNDRQSMNQKGKRKEKGIKCEAESLTVDS